METQREVGTEFPVRQFESYLAKLDRSSKQSILIAREEFLKTYSTANPEVSSDAFRHFFAFYRDAISACNHEFYRNRILQDFLHLISTETNSYDAPLSALAKSKTSAAAKLRTRYARELEQLNEYKRCGIDFAMSEGDWYLKEDSDFLLKTAESLTGGYREYILFYIEESRQRMAEDAGLLISWEDLRKRIIRWEQFARDHSSLPEARSVMEPEIQSMMTSYLLGTDNTPAYDFSKKGAIDPKLFRSYASFLKQNSASRYSRLVGSIYQSLNASQRRMSKELLDLLKGAGYHNSALERKAAILFSSSPK